MAAYPADTIVAQATPAGRGGVGIIRISGLQAKNIATKIAGELPQPRFCTNRSFKDQQGNVIDTGLVIYFKAPHSFTGEDVVELQGHGGPIVLDMLLQEVIHLGARLAKPGEFSERAFLNDKIDLAQAEAIVDLINSESKQAALSAVRSLKGEFSTKINQLLEKLIEIRMYVESAIDFPEEEVDFMSDGKITESIESLLKHLTKILETATQGAILRDGITVVLAGKPNAGKSSLLNRLSGKDTAIVTDIPGTTRDILKEKIIIDGIPLHVIDTAGLRDSNDIVEQEGVKRAWQQISEADRILIVVDSSENHNTAPEALWSGFDSKFISKKKITIIYNKIDKTNLPVKCYIEGQHTVIQLSAKKNQGIDLLCEHLKQSVGADTQQESIFIARRRHLDALLKVKNIINSGLQQFYETYAGELLAEDLLQMIY